MRTSLGDTTVKAPDISEPCSRMDSRTAFAEVLVESEEDPLFAVRELKHGFVDTRGELRDIDDVMAVLTKESDNRRVHALVGEQPHTTDSESG